MSKQFIVFFTVFLLERTNAQNSISLGPQIGLASNFSKSAKMGFGGSLDYANKFSEQLGARISIGYNRFNGKYFNDYVSFVPVRAGLQAYLVPEIFILGDAGLAMEHDNNNNSKSGFSFSLGAGYHIPLSAKQFVQLSANYNYFRYDKFLNYTWFNIRAAYGLSWGKKMPAKDE